MTREEVIKKYGIRKGTNVSCNFQTDSGNTLAGEVIFSEDGLMVIKQFSSGRVFQVEHDACAAIEILGQADYE